MQITIQTLTPIWTGGIDGTTDRLHETGIIGSLRWWYEAIARGLGGYACDPTSDHPEHRCQFDSKAYEKTKNIEDGLAGVCPVCRLFGCTGWKRRFELNITGSNLQPFCLATKDKPQKFNHWWLSEIYKTAQNNVVFGQLTLRFQWMRGYENQHQTMQALISLISKLGGLGAKPQYGFGIFFCTESDSIHQDIATIKQNLVNPTIPKNLQGEYPTLTAYWLLQCAVSNEDINRHFSRLNIIGNEQTFYQNKPRLLPVSFDIRYKLPASNDQGLRQAYRLQHGKMPTRQLFGTLEGDKRASSIFVSHLYKESTSQSDYQLRVWGFTTSEIINEIEKNLKNIFPNLRCTQTIGLDILNSVEV